MLYVREEFPSKLSSKYKPNSAVGNYLWKLKIQRSGYYHALTTLILQF